MVQFSWCELVRVVKVIINIDTARCHNIESPILDIVTREQWQMMLFGEALCGCNEITWWWWKLNDKKNKQLSQQIHGNIKELPFGNEKIQIKLNIN